MKAGSIGTEATLVMKASVLQEVSIPPKKGTKELKIEGFKNLNPIILNLQRYSKG